MEIVKIPKADYINRATANTESHQEIPLNPKKDVPHPTKGSKKDVHETT